MDRKIRELVEAIAQAVGEDHEENYGPAQPFPPEARPALEAYRAKVADFNRRRNELRQRAAGIKAEGEVLRDEVRAAQLATSKALEAIVPALAAAEQHQINIEDGTYRLGVEAPSEPKAHEGWVEQLLKEGSTLQ